MRRSKLTAADRAHRDIVRDQVFSRDRYQCVLARVDSVAGKCAGPITFHHRRKASAAGAYVEANGRTLCAGHNLWVEDKLPILAADDPDYWRPIMTDLVVREGHPEWEVLGVRANR